ncbi:MAG TPA: chemotaxis protein CheW [Phycisphaerales bacterium]|nr:chemotaxis protein CheW [Phycisphaerales bacterium]HMP38237.1 chemotaxis protein CheW [Phycisphaerales bacterium]
MDRSSQNAPSPRSRLDAPAVDPDNAATGPDGAEYLARRLSADEIAEQTRRVAEPAGRTMAEPVTLLVMQLGAERLAMPAIDARRVVRRAPVRRVPHRMSPFFAGLCAVDGRLVPAANLRRLLELQETQLPAGAARTIVFGDQRGDWAVEVDRVEGVRRADLSSFVEPPATVALTMGRYIRALGEFGGARGAVLDTGRVLSAFAGALR